MSTPPLSPPPGAPVGGNPKRPSNLARSLTHIAGGLTAVGLIQLIPSDHALLIIATTYCAAVWGIEISRRMWPAWNKQVLKVVGKIAHAHEQEGIASSTWFATALFILSLLGGGVSASVGVTVLAIGDPAAGWFGRRWGKHRLASGRSWEGAAAFVIAGGLAAFTMLRLFYPGDWSGLAALTLATVGAAAGSLSEMLVDRVDDNLIIPLAAGGASALVAIAFA